MAKEIKRIYSGSDAGMLEKSKTIRGCFLEDKADFIAYDSLFSDPFISMLNQKVEGAENIIQDNSIIDQQVQLTNAVNSAMEGCKNHFQTMKRFIERAFPNNKAVWNEFG